MGECEEERNTSSVRRNCYWLILCNSWVLSELCLEKCGSQNSKRAPKLLFSAVQTPYNPLPLNVGESSGYHRLSLPWLGHTIWQRWKSISVWVHQKRDYPKWAWPIQMGPLKEGVRHETSSIRGVFLLTLNQQLPYWWEGQQQGRQGPVEIEGLSLPNLK